MIRYRINDKIRLHNSEHNPEWDEFPVTGFVYGYSVNPEAELLILIKLDNNITTEEPLLVHSIIVAHPDNLIKI